MAKFIFLARCVLCWVTAARESVFLLYLQRDEKAICHNIADSGSDLVYRVDDAGIQLCKDDGGSGM